MEKIKNFSPAVQHFLNEKDWQGLLEHLDTLSNAKFRTVGNELAESVLPELSEPDAWTMVSAFTAHNSKAYLVTMLKSVSKMFKNGTLHLHSNGAKGFFLQISDNPIDVQKVSLHLLPVMDIPDDIQWLFLKLNVDDGEPRIRLLLRIGTLSAAFMLFRSTKYIEHDRALLVRVTHFLIKQGDNLSFNLASLLRTYYGLEEVRGTFSLALEPYQLARLDSNYEAFCEVMRR